MNVFYWYKLQVKSVNLRWAEESSPFLHYLLRVMYSSTKEQICRILFPLETTEYIRQLCQVTYLAKCYKWALPHKGSESRYKR